MEDSVGERGGPASSVTARRLGLAITAAAAGMGSVAFVHGYPTAIYDSLGYYILSVVLRTTGLTPWPTDLRTYGYPFFLDLVTLFRDLAPEETRLLAFVAQLAVFLAVCFFVSRRLARLLRSESLGVWAYAVAALNPILLIHTTELLSDLVSAVLIQLSVALSWKMPPAQSMVPARSRPAWPVFLSFACAGASVAVRPANAVVVAAIAAVWLLRAIRWRELRIASVAAALAGLIPPLVPQMIINYSLSKKLNPLIVASLYRQQRSWGMGSLKYGTVLIDGRSPFLTYANPLYAGDPGPRAFLVHHPWRYLGTLGLHAFAMLDPDLPYTYITDLSPSYRWPLGVLNFLLLYLALVGLLVAAARTARERRLDELGFAVASTVIVAAAYVAVYLPVAVESRFGIAVQLLATPLIIVGGRWLLRPSKERRAVRALAAAAAPAVVLGCALLSAWIESTQTNRFVESPANALVMDPPRARVLTPAPRTPEP